MIFVLSKMILIQNGSAFCNGRLSIVTDVYSRLFFSRMPPVAKKKMARFNVGRFMRERKVVRDLSAIYHESIQEEKLALQAAKQKLGRLRTKVSVYCA